MVILSLAAALAATSGPAARAEWWLIEIERARTPAEINPPPMWTARRW
jgi:hypothetical protein